MAMSRKDYEAIALAILTECKTADTLASEREQQGARFACRRIAKRIGVYCASDNLNFVHARFLKACGIPEE